MRGHVLRLWAWTNATNIFASCPLTLATRARLGESPRSTCARARTGARIARVSEHSDKRTNIPTNELRGFVDDDEKRPKSTLYSRDARPSLESSLRWAWSCVLVDCDAAC